MESVNISADTLRKQIQIAESELSRLKQRLVEVEAIQDLKKLSVENDPGPVTSDETKWPLLPGEYKRYGRQMIVPSIGIQGILSFSCHAHSLGLELGLAILRFAAGRFC